MKKIENHWSIETALQQPEPELSWTIVVEWLLAARLDSAQVGSQA